MNGKARQVDLLFQVKRYADAEKIIRKLLEEEPNNSTSLTWLALCRFNQRDSKGAVDLVMKALEKNELPATNYLLLAQVYIDQASYLKALKWLNKGRSSFPNDFRFLYYWAFILLREGRRTEALKHIDKGLELAPESIDLLHLKITILRIEGKIEAASAVLEMAQNLNPVHQENHGNKGWINLKEKNFEEALSAFEEALSLNPKSLNYIKGYRYALKTKHFLWYRFLLRIILDHKNTIKWIGVACIGLIFTNVFLVAMSYIDNFYLMYISVGVLVGIALRSSIVYYLDTLADFILARQEKYKLSYTQGEREEFNKQLTILCIFVLGIGASVLAVLLQ
ncbi:MAG: tetratricopeptide repeat protein [Lewinella sp.]|uniref:tetratricopeptide repeat protein n=1 Tax=Lewinella sp. TaxID=2004506 RepID=UPI003D6AEE4B